MPPKPSNPDCFSPLKLSDSEYESIRKLVYDHFGIHLSDQKHSLVVGRLQRLLRTKGFESFEDYCDYVCKDTSRVSLLELANRISTNHTFFYREKAHFDFFLSTALPQALSSLECSGSRDLRLWSAGCSSGEEPYTLIMLMMEYFGPQYSAWDSGVLATDISEQALALARRGVYAEERASLMPQALRAKYFTKLPDGDLAVSERVKQEVTFRRFNLMNEQFPFKKPFHAIFCRNVMIYFDQSTRDALIQRFFDVTEPGGYLFIGHAETISRSTSPYGYVMPAVYRKG